MPTDTLVVWKIIFFFIGIQEMIQRIVKWYHGLTDFQGTTLIIGIFVFCYVMIFFTGRHSAKNKKNR